MEKQLLIEEKTYLEKCLSGAISDKDYQLALGYLKRIVSIEQELSIIN